MTLKVYRQKRDFKKTPEPKGKKTATKKIKNLYIIQKHAASHLHYDFRLELNGVLLSWAVPKGPSLDPSVKRLAMHVEDHPVEYGSFEGIIPKGEYGGGTVMLWDKGKWVCEDKDPIEAYRKGNLKFELDAEKLQGKWKLIRINHNDKTWLLMKSKDEYAESAKKYDITVEEPNSVLTQQSIDEIAKNYKKVWGRKGLVKNPSLIKPSKKKIKKNPIKINLPIATYPKIIYPQLATLIDRPPLGEKWLHEIKFDGYRLLAFKRGEKVSLLTRNQNDWTHVFPNVATAISNLPIDNCILDGEVVVLDKDQHSDFQLLQNSIKEKKSPFIFYIFDLLYFDKYNLMNLKLIERKNILQSFMQNAGDHILRYSDHILGSGEDIFKKSCELGLEGIISKNMDSPYSQTRDKNWLKIKCIQRQEFVIGGFMKPLKRKYFRSLMLGTFNKKKELVYNGNVGTGFTETSLKNIYDKLSKYVTKTIPFNKNPPGIRSAVWVKPVLVAEVEFTEWTNEGTLRHPSFKGLRLDKPAKKIVKEKELPIENVLSAKEDTSMPQKKSIHKKPAEKQISNLITHPDKILYPEDKITKGQLAEYYESVHEWILPYISNRPLSLVRCPANYKQCFYQKHLAHKFPAGLHGIMIKEKKDKDKYIYLDNEEGLLALVQMGVLEIHPWGSKVNDVEHPDMIVFDLDPAPEIPWKKIVKGAFEIKAILESLKLKSFVKTTGGKGLHVVVPIKPEYDWEEVKNFSHVLVQYLVKEYPEEYLHNMNKAKRKGKIFVDYLRNSRGATAIAAYSTRARPHAPVSVPLDWDELTNNRDDTFFTITDVPDRLASLKKDPWANFFKIKQSLKLDKVK